MVGIFLVAAFEEGGKRATDRAVRLVCLTQANERVVVWGSEGNTRNIDAVLAAALPCEIECETRPPAEWAVENHGHDYWVPQGARLRVL